MLWFTGKGTRRKVATTGTQTEAKLTDKLHRTLITQYGCRYHADMNCEAIAGRQWSSYEACKLCA
eukprot:12899205-Prorocentrum_lima.AAC.1